MANIISEKYRQKFHLEPPEGWLNDPNGLCYFNDEYHVFFGGRFENGVSASFIWHYGDPIGDKIQPDKVEWMEEINDDLYNR